MTDNEHNAIHNHLERASIELTYALLDALTQTAAQPSGRMQELVALLSQCKGMVELAIQIAQRGESELLEHGA